MCLHEVDPLQNAKGNNEVTAIDDKRHIHKWFERKS